MVLTQQETNKIKERDEKHVQELREWRQNLKKRKQVSPLLLGCLSSSLFPGLPSLGARLSIEQSSVFPSDLALLILGTGR